MGLCVSGTQRMDVASEKSEIQNPASCSAAPFSPWTTILQWWAPFETSYFKVCKLIKIFNCPEKFVVIVRINEWGFNLFYIRSLYHLFIFISPVQTWMGHIGTWQWILCLSSSLSCPLSQFWIEFMLCWTHYPDEGIPLLLGVLALGVVSLYCIMLLHFLSQGIQYLNARHTPAIAYHLIQVSDV